MHDVHKKLKNLYKLINTSQYSFWTARVILRAHW